MCGVIHAHQIHIENLSRWWSWLGRNPPDPLDAAAVSDAGTGDDDVDCLAGRELESGFEGGGLGVPGRDVCLDELCAFRM